IPLELSSTVSPGRTTPVSRRCRTAAVAETTFIVSNLRQTSPSSTCTRSGVPMAWLMWSGTSALLHDRPGGGHGRRGGGRCRRGGGRCRPGGGRCRPGGGRCRPGGEHPGGGDACVLHANAAAVNLPGQLG